MHANSRSGLSHSGGARHNTAHQQRRQLSLVRNETREEKLVFRCICLKSNSSLCREKTHRLTLRTNCAIFRIIELTVFQSLMTVNTLSHVHDGYAQIRYSVTTLLTRYHMRGHFGSLKRYKAPRLTRFRATCCRTHSTYAQHTHTALLSTALSVEALSTAPSANRYSLDGNFFVSIWPSLRRFM